MPPGVQSSISLTLSAAIAGPKDSEAIMDASAVARSFIFMSFLRRGLEQVGRQVRSIVVHAAGAAHDAIFRSYDRFKCSQVIRGYQAEIRKAVIGNVWQA